MNVPCSFGNALSSCSRTASSVGKTLALLPSIAFIWSAYFVPRLEPTVENFCSACVALRASNVFELLIGRGISLRNGGFGIFTGDLPVRSWDEVADRFEDLLAGTENRIFPIQ